MPYQAGVTVALEIPDGVAAKLKELAGSLERQALEALAVEAYRERRLTTREVMELLGFESRLQAWDFLGAHKVWPQYGPKELEEDLATLKKLESS